MEDYRECISDAEYELESPGKQEKAVIHEMRRRYKAAAAAAAKL
jgi:hypothetical protein